MKPDKKINIGRVSASIWRNPGDRGNNYKIEFSKLTKTETGWDSSKNFYKEDLLALSKLADMCHTWIIED